MQGLCLSKFGFKMVGHLCIMVIFLLSLLPQVLLQDLHFTLEPNSIIVRRGSSAILNCQTNIKTVDVIIQWKKGYQSSWIYDYNNKSYQLLSNHSLFFPSVGTNDENVYFCAAYYRRTRKTIYSNNPAHITLAYIRPTFISSPLSESVREHETVILTCTSGPSQPFATVSWEKDGEAIKEKNDITAQNILKDRNATSSTLLLKNVSIFRDTAYYRCVALNPLLPDEPQVSPRARLTVLPSNDHPQIYIHPVNTLAPIRRPLRIDCFIVGVPDPVIFWLHDNMRVINDSNRMVYKNGSLIFKSLTIKDNGQYSCNGTNDKGSVTSSDVFLTVAYIDFYFKQDPMSKTVINGSRVEMTCDPPDHHPKRLKYTWYKNYKPISSGSRYNSSPTSGRLLISPVISDDQGAYFCQVKSVYSMETRASRVAYLTVYVPPYFLTKPSDKAVVWGSTLRLICIVAGFPMPHVTWYHDNKLLGNSSRLSLHDNGSLVLNLIDVQDFGQYKCSAKNVAGIRNAFANVVVYTSPNITIKPRSIAEVYGKNATFYCRFSGNPSPLIKWYFIRSDKTMFVTDKNLSRYIQRGDSLIVVNVTEQDNGAFVCVGKNIVGTQNFSASLEVLVPARVVRSPRNVTVNESGVAIMTCSGYGNPVPFITWLRYGLLMTNTSRMTIIAGLLRIRRVTINDTGIYICNVGNSLKNASSSGYLTVQVSPAIQRIVGPSRVEWRQNISFICEAFGVPTPRISWYKDGVPILYNKRINGLEEKLTIINTNHNDTGFYTCKAFNIINTIFKIRQLIVEVPPNKPMYVKIINTSYDSLHIIWMPDFDGNSPIIFYKVQINVNMSLEWRDLSMLIKSENFTVRNLQAYTLYYVRVYAANKVGWSEPSDTIWARTLQDYPSQPLRLRCQALNHSTIFLEWNEPTNPNGIIRNYLVEYNNSSFNANLHVSMLIHYMFHLKSFTWYTFKVKAATIRDGTLLWGNFSSNTSCRTGESAPSSAPKLLSLIALGSHSIMAKWQDIPADSKNGIIRGYYLQYKTTNDKDVMLAHADGNNSLAYNITRLKPWSKYEIRVAAVTVAIGPWSEWKMSMTMEDVPSGKPRDIVVMALSSISLLVSWTRPSLETQNGVILGYDVLYKESGSTKLSRIFNVTNTTSVVLSGLTPFTGYDVRIRAFTKIGPGPYSEDVFNKTLESYPDVIHRLTYNITKTSVVFTWDPPHVKNGIIVGYITYVNYTTTIRSSENNVTSYNATRGSWEVATKETRAEFEIVYGNVTYIACVTARTSVGLGSCSNPLTFSTNLTKIEMAKTSEKKTTSIFNDYFPLIIGGSLLLLILLFIILICCCIHRRNRKKQEQTKENFNFQRKSFQMGSFNDDDSSNVSLGSRDNRTYSVESSSIHSHVNPSNTFATTGITSDGSPLMRLRSNSPSLGSDASFYDAPYSSVAEIGVDPATVIPAELSPSQPSEESRHQFVNTLYNERKENDQKDASIDPYQFVNTLYNERKENAQKDASIDSYITINPLYETTKIETSQQDDEHNNDVGAEDNKSQQDLLSQGILFLPPPPPEYSDYDDVDILHAYTNEVTDF